MVTRPGDDYLETMPASASLEAEYARLRGELHAFFTRRARKRADIEDLVQEVYERLLRYPPATPVRNPAAYLFQTAWNVLRDANRSQKVSQRRYLPCEPLELEGHIEGQRRLWIEEDGGSELAWDEFEQVLSALPKACQVALLRQRRDGWTYQQIADELGVSINTVKDYLTKALDHFRSHFRLGSQHAPKRREKL